MQRYRNRSLRFSKGFIMQGIEFALLTPLKWTGNLVLTLIVSFLVFAIELLLPVLIVGVLILSSPGLIGWLWTWTHLRMGWLWPHLVELWTHLMEYGRAAIEQLMSPKSCNYLEDFLNSFLNCLGNCLYSIGEVWSSIRSSSKGVFLSFLPSPVRDLDWQELAKLLVPVVVIALGTLGVLQNWFNSAWKSLKEAAEHILEYIREYNYCEKYSTKFHRRKAQILGQFLENFIKIVGGIYQIVCIVILFWVALGLALTAILPDPPMRSVVGFPVFFGNASGINGRIDASSPGVRLQSDQKRQLVAMAKLLIELIGSERKPIPELLVIGYASPTPITICKNCDEDDPPQRKKFEQNWKINRVAANHRAKHVGCFLREEVDPIKINIKIKKWKDYESLKDCLPYQQQLLPSTPLDDSILKRMNQSVMIYAMPKTNEDNETTNHKCFSSPAPVLCTDQSD